ncbi:unnamed protein product [Ambrosiozyma monospora]|uniref:Unnamed protein product n=1 Tax=Ambrosiozyma monospora TaxID=43982 RepID=A0ACB5SU34_AMBMO|nr:unnamed protein product [Ambrosiozyma monospora]
MPPKRKKTTQDKDESGCTFDGIIHEFPNVRIDNFSFDYLDKLQPNTTISSTRSAHKRRKRRRSPPKIKYFFISHAHTDHLKGFDTSENLQFCDRNYKVICTETTRKLLSSSPMISGLDSSVRNSYFRKIETFQMNKRFRLSGLDDDVSEVFFTLIPNFHCLGSVMILIERRPNLSLSLSPVPSTASSTPKETTKSILHDIQLPFQQPQHQKQLLKYRITTPTN